MSAESDFRAALVAYAPLVSLVGQHVAQNAADQAWAPPYVVSTAQHAPEYGLGGALLGDIVTFEAQCWATTAVQASALADTVAASLAVVDAPPTGRATGYDEELALDAVLLTVPWVTG